MLQKEEPHLFPRKHPHFKKYIKNLHCLNLHLCLFYIILQEDPHHYKYLAFTNTCQEFVLLIFIESLLIMVIDVGVKLFASGLKQTSL